MALLSGGGYAQYCVVDERLLMLPPAGMELQEAGAIPEVPPLVVTAHLS